jgi:hypothetical protein
MDHGFRVGLWNMRINLFPIDFICSSKRRKMSTQNGKMPGAVRVISEITKRISLIFYVHNEIYLADLILVHVNSL